jgi:hypothetical protein
MPRVGHFHWASRAVTMSLRIAFRTLSKFNHFSGFSDYYTYRYLYYYTFTHTKD